MFFEMLWLSVVVSLPAIVAWRVFTNEPKDRFFASSWVISVFGSLLIAFGISLGLAIFDLGLFGMFDGIIILPAAVIVSAVVGLVVRRKQKSSLKAYLNAPNP